MRELHIKIPEFKALNIIVLLVLAVLFVFGVLIIKNINEEYGLRKIAGQFQEFKYASLSFNNIYSGLPGDIDNASLYWKELTRNGNADKKIDHLSGEGIAAFQQLQLAKLIKLPYTLTGKWQDGSDGVLLPEINAPGDKNINTAFYFSYSEALGVNIFGYGETDGSNNIINKPALTPHEAYALDLMTDDGYPAKGSMIAATDIAVGCYVAGEYKQEKEMKECILLFKL